MNDETEAGKPAPRDMKLFEILIGGGVLLISIVSIFVAVSANRTQERMLAASVWPSLLYGTSDAGTDGRPQISLDLLNRGVGPARVRWAEVRYDGTPVRGSRSLLSRCCGLANEDDAPAVFTTGIQRRVMGPGEWIQLMRVAKPEAPSPVYEALSRGRGKIELRLCYCSVLDDCWLLDSRSDDDPEPVKRCPAAPAVLWGG